MLSYSSFLKQEMKKEFAVLSEGFQEHQRAYEMELRNVLLKYIDGCLPATAEDRHSANFDMFRNLALKTKIFQDSHVNPEFECTSSLEQLERLAGWVLDPDSDPDYEFDMLRITRESFNKNHLSVRELLLSNLEYNLDLYIKMHAINQGKELPHLPLPS